MYITFFSPQLGIAVMEVAMGMGIIHILVIIAIISMIVPQIPL